MLPRGEGVSVSGTLSIIVNTPHTHTHTPSQVFFPMLSHLLEDIPTGDCLNLEETRVRASNLLCKVRERGRERGRGGVGGCVHFWANRNGYLHLMNTVCPLMHVSVPSNYAQENVTFPSICKTVAMSHEGLVC